MAIYQEMVAALVVALYRFGNHGPDVFSFCLRNQAVHVLTELTAGGFSRKKVVILLEIVLDHAGYQRRNEIHRAPPLQSEVCPNYTCKAA